MSNIASFFRWTAAGAEEVEIVDYPGEMILEEFLKPLGVTQTEFAPRIDVAWTRANQLVSGKRFVTPDTALRLDHTSKLSWQDPITSELP